MRIQGIENINWNDAGQVCRAARQLADGGPAQIVFWNGRNYQITFAENRKEIEAKGYSVLVQYGDVA